MTALPHRVLVSHAPPEAYAPMTRAILVKLGYAILLPEELETCDPERSKLRPSVRLVDERQLGEIPDDGQSIPIVVLSGRHGVSGADTRIAGAVRRPAGIHELYRLIQQLTEDTPRATPRVATHLPARCGQRDAEWGVTILSISENGCLLRSPEPLLLGARVALRFTLPGAGLLDLQAEAAYQLLPDVGMIFDSTPAHDREAIADFVTKTLAV